MQEVGDDYYEKRVKQILGDIYPPKQKAKRKTKYTPWECSGSSLFLQLEQQIRKNKTSLGQYFSKKRGKAQNNIRIQMAIARGAHTVSRAKRAHTWNRSSSGLP